MVEEEASNMKNLSIAFLLLSVLSVNSVPPCIVDLGTWIKPCAKDDVEGFEELVKSFLSAVVTGIPKNNVKNLDPLVYRFLVMPVEEGVTFYFSHLKINNLSAVDVCNAVLDTKANTTEIHMKLNLNMTANIAILFDDGINSVAVGNIKFYLDTKQMSCNTLYGFKTAPDEKGVDYFTVLEDNNNCSVIKDPIMTFSPSLEEIQKDPELNCVNVYLNNDDCSWKKKLTRNIVELVIARLIDNFRIACRILPASKYITDISC